MQFLQSEAFAGRVGESFDMSLGETSAALTLVGIQPLPPQVHPGMQRSPFALLFRSASQLVMPQKIYRLNNAELGAIDVFLVPVGRDPQGVVYQAVFN